MSRFKRSLHTPPIAPFLGCKPAVTGIANVHALPEVVASTLTPQESTGRSGFLETLGYVLYCTYIISGFINEWTIRLLGGKAYISTVLVVLVPAVLLVSNNRFRGLKHAAGRWWTVFLLLLLLDMPFSAWKGGTTTLLLNYVPRSYAIFFFVTAFAVTLNRVKGLMVVGIATSTIVLFNCYKFGVLTEDGRLRLQDSLFFANSNDLGLQLLMGVTQFGFLFHEKGLFKKVFAAGCIVLSVMYMLRTGSRGCLLAMVCYGVLRFFFSRNKLLFLALTAVIGLVGVGTLPSMTLRRLTLLGLDDHNIETSAEASAVGSQAQRRELLRRSIVETLKHPVFGVGPGQFGVYVTGEKLKKGEEASWVGTHNSYTEVSAECGIPALVCYCAVIVICFRLNYGMFRATRDNPVHREVAGLSLALLSGTLVYSIGTFFFHMAYSAVLPGLSAMTVALYFVTKPVIEASAKAKPAAEPPARGIAAFRLRL